MWSKVCFDIWVLVYYRNVIWYYLFNFLTVIVKREIRIPIINLHNIDPVYRFIISRKCRIIIKGFPFVNERVWFTYIFILVKPRNNKYLFQMTWISCFKVCWGVLFTRFGVLQNMLSINILVLLVIREGRKIWGMK